MVIPATRTDITFTSSIDATNLVDLSFELIGDLIKVSSDDIFQVFVLSLTGKVLIKKNIKNSGKLNVRKLAPGRYLLKIETGTNTSVTIFERE